MYKDVFLLGTGSISGKSSDGHSPLEALSMPMFPETTHRTRPGKLKVQKGLRVNTGLCQICLFKARQAMGDEESVSEEVKLFVCLHDLMLLMYEAKEQLLRGNKSEYVQLYTGTLGLVS